MTADEILAELADLDRRWEELRKSLEESGGMSGSPGEWIVERSGELDYELRRRRDGCAT